jgi:hypothetical protein
MFGGVNESDPLCEVYNSLQTSAVWSIVDAGVRKVTSKVSFGTILNRNGEQYLLLSRIVRVFLVLTAVCWTLASFWART